MNVRLIAWSGIVGVCCAILLANSRVFQARFMPPTGPFAERLAALHYDRQGRPLQSATDVLNDVLSAYRVKRGQKGPKSPVNEALKAARFACSTLYEFGSPDIYVCRNNAAGYTTGGCRLDWLVLIELRPGDGTVAGEPEKRRAFVRAHC